MRAASNPFKVAILSGNHLCHNPRVFKEAKLLRERGLSCIVLGGWTNHALAIRDQELAYEAGITFRPVVDCTKKNSTTYWLGTTKNRLSNLIFRRLGIASRWQFGRAISALLAESLKCNAKLYIAHSEQALACAHSLSRQGKKIAVDFEDWFSEDLLPDARKNRPVELLRRMECECSRIATFTLAPSMSMSKAIGEEYQCAPPIVIYNSFPWEDRRSLDGKALDRRDPTVPSIHWFSQTLGPGRGLEILLRVLATIEAPFELHLRGHSSQDSRNWLHSIVPDSLSRKIFIHDLVPNATLLSRIAEHDIGFAGEQTYCRSRNLTVTNKILQYLLGGLAVIASDTEGQREVAELSGNSVKLFPAESMESLHSALLGWLNSPLELAKAKAKALEVAERHFCFEKTQDKLFDAFLGAAEG